MRGTAGNDRSRLDEAFSRDALGWAPTRRAPGGKRIRRAPDLRLRSWPTAGSRCSTPRNVPGRLIGADGSRRCARRSGRTPRSSRSSSPFPWRWRRQAMRAALQRSLERLQVPAVDVYLLHFPWPPVSIEILADTLADLVVGLGAAWDFRLRPAETRRAPPALARPGWFPLPATRWSTAC